MKFKNIIISLVYLFTTFCSSIPPQNSFKIRPESIANLALITVPNINEEDLNKKISTFEERLLKSNGNLTPSDWALHDELLDIYIALKNKTIQETKIIIPARSKLQLRLTSFCLDSLRGIPSEKEGFRWIKGNPNISYYKDILKRVARGKLSSRDAQSLLWSLGNKTKWENYPDRLRNELYLIDSNARFKLPSITKDKALDFLSDTLFSKMPILNDVQNAIRYVEGEYYEYNDIVKNIAKLTTKPTTNRSSDIIMIPDTNLYSEITSDSYSFQNITIYNLTENSQEFDLTDYYLIPERESVQRIGITGFDYTNTLPRLENVLFDMMLRLGIGFTPIVGDVADLYELITGRDFLNGSTLTFGERILSGIGLIIGSGQGLRSAKKIAYAPQRLVATIGEQLNHTTSKVTRISDDATDIIRQVERAKDAINTSPTLNKLAKNASKTDFYVRPNGEVIPAKGYRYISSNSSDINEIIRTGKLTPKPKRAIYISFDKIDNSAIAKNKLQIPSQNDAAIRVEFNTNQLDDLHIPNGGYGKSSYLEPIAHDNPNWGDGGGYQAITNKTIKIDQAIDLKTENIIYENNY